MKWSGPHREDGYDQVFLHCEPKNYNAAIAVGDALMFDLADDDSHTVAGDVYVDEALAGGSLGRVKMSTRGYRVRQPEAVDVRLFNFAGLAMNSAPVLSWDNQIKKGQRQTPILVLCYGPYHAAKFSPTPITDDSIITNLASLPAPVLAIPDIEKRGRLTGIASSATALLGNPAWIHMVCGFTFDSLQRDDAYRAGNGTYTMPVFIKAMGM